MLRLLLLKVLDLEHCCKIFKYFNAYIFIAVSDSCYMNTVFFSVLEQYLSVFTIPVPNFGQVTVPVPAQAPGSVSGSGSVSGP